AGLPPGDDVMSTYVRTPPTAAWPVRLSVAGGAALTLAATAGALTGRPPRLDLIGEASPAIQIHLAAVVVALGVGAWQLLGPKGTTAHRLLGWTWTLADRKSTRLNSSHVKI